MLSGVELSTEWRLMVISCRIDANSCLEHRRKSLEELVAQVELKSPYQLHLDFGTPYLQALQLAERVNAGLMVIGAHDHTALGRLLMGSNTGYLVHNYEGSLYVHQEPQG